MIALIVKDIASIRKTLILTILISIGICAFGIYRNEIIFIPATCGILPLLLLSTAYGYDARSNFEQLAFSMPIKKSSYVLSRLFFPVSFGLIGGISFFILLMMEGGLSIKGITLISILILLVTVLISTIQLPFVIKFGEEKGRLIMVITYFVLFSFLSTLKGLIARVTDFLVSLSQYSSSMIGIATLAVLLLMIVISLKISIMLLEKQEY